MKTVITGETPDGRSIIVRQEHPTELFAPAFPQFGNTLLDANDGPIPLPNDGSRRRDPQFFPPPGGHRFFLLRIDPQSSAPSDPPTAEQFAEAESIFPELFSKYDDKGFEQTDTVDFGYVIRGSVVMVLGDGTEAALDAGDAFVQNGTRHRWYNPGEVPASLVVVVTGQHRN